MNSSTVYLPNNNYFVLPLAVPLGNSIINIVLVLWCQVNCYKNAITKFTAYNE